jgi:hypothetical protein
MWLPVKSPELVSVFKEASRNLKSIFLNNLDAKKIKTIAAHTESTALIFKPLNKIIHLMTLSL